MLASSVRETAGDEMQNQIESGRMRASCPQGGAVTLSSYLASVAFPALIWHSAVMGLFVYRTIVPSEFLGQGWVGFALFLFLALIHRFYARLAWIKLRSEYMERGPRLPLGFIHQIWDLGIVGGLSDLWASSLFGIFHGMQGNAVFIFMTICAYFSYQFLIMFSWWGLHLAFGIYGPETATALIPIWGIVTKVGFASYLGHYVLWYYFNRIGFYLPRLWSERRGIFRLLSRKPLISNDTLWWYKLLLLVARLSILALGSSIVWRIYIANYEAFIHNRLPLYGIGSEGYQQTSRESAVSNLGFTRGINHPAFIGLQWIWLSIESLKVYVEVFLYLRSKEPLHHLEVRISEVSDNI